MASLKKRGKYYSIVFKTHVDGKPVSKTYALGTKSKKIAEHKLADYERLYEKGEINPFNEDWNLKEYEEKQKINLQSSIGDSYYLEDLKEDFINFKAHLSAPSLKAYKSVIKLFIEHVGRSMTINLIEPSDIRSFCFQKNFSDATKRNYLRHLKVFFNWIEDKEIIKENPCKEVKPPKKKDKLVEKIITEQQFKDVLKKFREYQKGHKKAGRIKDSSQMQFWFKPIITTAFYTGMRRKELLQLRWEHADLEAREVHITDTKNGKERTVILFDPVYKRLKAWRKFLGNPTNGLVFPSPRSTDKIEIGLTGKTVSKAFKTIIKKSDVKNTMHFHGLRHSCATFMLKRGFDVLEVKDMLGHKSIQVTNRYVHLVSSDRKNKAEQLGLITV